LDKDAAVVATIRAGQRLSIQPEVQDMVQVRGIGKASEQRLYEAGVGTYWELANLTDEDLDRILRPNPAQRAQLDYPTVRTEALRLARETGTGGAIWNAKQIDDLEAISGISATFEQRLYEAGISTYEALAAATVAQLADCCRAPATMMPNYASWITAARERIAAAAPAAGNGNTGLPSESAARA
jgi:predicted flap endonuclease-1-like 5' DNA nuclease